MKPVLYFFATLLVLGPLVTYAHGGVEHATEAEAAAHTTLTDTEMRTIIALLQKLVVLLQVQVDAKRANMTHDIVIPEAVTAPIDVSEDVSLDDMPLYTVRKEDAATTEKLVIEVEEHHGSTHVHVRYVDKPEVMFFIQAALTDEAGMVGEISAKTGLTEKEIREALEYL